MNRIEVTLTIPEVLFQILQAAAWKENLPLSQMMLRDLVIDSDSYVAEHSSLQEKFGLETVEGQYLIPIAKLAGIHGFEPCLDLSPGEAEEPQLQRVPGHRCRILPFPRRD